MRKDEFSEEEACRIIKEFTELKESEKIMK